MLFGYALGYDMLLKPFVWGASYYGAHLYCPRAWWFWKLTLLPAVPGSFLVFLPVLGGASLVGPRIWGTWPTDDRPDGAKMNPLATYELPRATNPSVDLVLRNVQASAPVSVKVLAESVLLLLTGQMSVTGRNRKTVPGGA